MSNDESVAVSSHGVGFDHTHPSVDFEVEYIYRLKPDDSMVRVEKCADCSRVYSKERIQATDLVVRNGSNVLFHHGNGIDE